MKVGAESMELMASVKRASWTLEAEDGAAHAESAEADWIRAARSGDRAAFGALVQRHESTVLRVARRLLMDAHDAQDAAQDVFVRLYDHLHRFDERRPLTPWLYRITVNVCRTHARKRSRRTEAEHEAVRDAVRHHSEAGATEAADWLERGLSRLSPRERTALVLRDLEGLNATEAAKAMRCAPVTVRTLAARARLKLKRLHDAEQRGLAE
jgi:RNA polymerase sigma-70 factor (ECF subfamily)